MLENAIIDLIIDADIAEQSEQFFDEMELTLLDFINQIENGTEQLIGPFSTKDELWESLGI
jgi:hypothetical protein